jgi:hypothetical protein
MRVVPSRVTAARLTWIVAAGIIALLVVAGIDALHRSGSTSSLGSKSVSATAAETAALEVCGPQQLMLSVDRLGDDLALALRKVGETACRTRRLPITLTLLDREGLPAEAATNIQQAFRPTTHSPNVEVFAGFAVLYKCGEAKPETYVAEAGSYHTGGRLPRTDAECLNALGP